MQAREWAGRRRDGSAWLVPVPAVAVRPSLPRCSLPAAVRARTAMAPFSRKASLLFLSAAPFNSTAPSATAGRHKKAVPFVLVPHASTGMQFGCHADRSA